MSNTVFGLNLRSNSEQSLSVLWIGACHWSLKGARLKLKVLYPSKLSAEVFLLDKQKQIERSFPLSCLLVVWNTSVRDCTSLLSLTSNERNETKGNVSTVPQTLILLFLPHSQTQYHGDTYKTTPSFWLIDGTTMPFGTVQLRSWNMPTSLTNGNVCAPLQKRQPRSNTSVLMPQIFSNKVAPADGLQEEEKQRNNSTAIFQFFLHWSAHVLCFWATLETVVKRMFQCKQTGKTPSEFHVMHITVGRCGLMHCLRITYLERQHHVDDIRQLLFVFRLVVVYLLLQYPIPVLNFSHHCHSLLEAILHLPDDSLKLQEKFDVTILLQPRSIELWVLSTSQVHLVVVLVALLHGWTIGAFIFLCETSKQKKEGYVTGLVQWLPGHALVD